MGHHDAEDTPLIRLTGVSKSYPLSQERGSPLAQVWSRLKGQEPAQVFKALIDINLEVFRGQSLGLVGINGAGKSTLLKLIAGVVKPTQGLVQVRGRVGALLELGAGFHPDYTGRQNIDLACALMGLSPSQTRDKVADIQAFADIGPHIDQPIKHYSSGMVVRLGFAVATSVVPEVLITDEVLAVGDESFQKKCMTWMQRYLNEGGTLLLCSHSTYHIEKLCQRAAWIEHGRLHMLDDAQRVTRQYLAWHEEKNRPPQDLLAGEAVPDAGGIYQVKQMSLNDLPEDAAVTLDLQGKLVVSGLVASPDGRTPQVAVGVVRADGTPVYGVVSEMDGHTLQADARGLFAFRIVFDDLPLLPGRYVARAHAMDPEGLRLFDHVERPFDVLGDSRELGYVHLKHRWLKP
ncbi:sugar ABC transporter ATP-binding protein [Limnohabitans sp. 2KL-51]|nr:sugar ABC transporter ATP-binding protein [Limnohabitans sp. 2KL-51]